MFNYNPGQEIAPHLPSKMLPPHMPPPNYELFLLFQTPPSSSVLTVEINFACFWTSYKCNHTTGVLLCLNYFVPHCNCEIHACIHSYMHTTWYNILLSEDSTLKIFFCYTVNGDLDCFQLGMLQIMQIWIVLVHICIHICLVYA